MVDNQGILAATAAFALPPLSLAMHRSIDGSHEENLPLDIGARLCVREQCELRQGLASRALGKAYCEYALMEGRRLSGQVTPVG